MKIYVLILAFLYLSINGYTQNHVRIDLGIPDNNAYRIWQENSPNQYSNTTYEVFFTVPHSGILAFMIDFMYIVRDYGYHQESEGLVSSSFLLTNWVTGEAIDLSGDRYTKGDFYFLIDDAPFSAGHYKLEFFAHVVPGDYLEGGLFSHSYLTNPNPSTSAGTRPPLPPLPEPPKPVDPNFPIFPLPDPESSFNAEFAFDNETFKLDNSTSTSNKESFQTTDKENYIMAITPMNATSNIYFEMVNLNNDNLVVDSKQDPNAHALVSIQYFDGLGRPVQTIQKGMTPDKTGDWVSLQTYDGFGRENESWLPAVIKSNNGKYNEVSVVQSASKASNLNDVAPYSRTVYETSSLNRVLEQYGPGTAWYTNAKAVRTGYLTNTAKTTLSLTLADSLVCAQITYSKDMTYTYTKNYDVGQLYVTRMTDEDGNRGYEFKDKLGQVLLTRQIIDSQLHDTYYVYNKHRNLSAVFPPIASQLIYQNVSQLNGNEIKDKYAYYYKYDTRNLCVEKKLPGADWIHYIYDSSNNLVLSQDGEQRKRNNEWTFMLYDIFNRVALTGIVQNEPDIKLGLMDGRNQIRFRAYFNKSVTNYGYQLGVSIPISQIHTVNYYDSYDFLVHNNLTNTHKYVFQDGYDSKFVNAKGLLTGTITSVLDEKGVTTRTSTAFYYDKKGQLIQSHSTNHLGGKESEYLALNFTGQALKRKLVHTNPKAGTTATTEVYTHTYDHTGRLLNTYHQLNTGSNTLIASNTYDDLGRLKTNKKGNQVNLTTTYTYDIRSRTRSMNSYHLGFALEYTYGSNISKQSWAQEGVSRSYAFTYDGLSRLKKATFSGGKAGEKFTTSYSYDRHGNIKTMTREGKKGTTYALVDNLTFTHNGNQLTNIKDAVVETAKPEGETDFYSQAGNNGLITYNANGAMTSDTHKGIGSMTYNALNLPASITVNSHALTSGNVKYLYSASGAKVQSVHTENTNLRSMALMGTATYAAGNPSVTTTDYIGNKVYENNKIKRILIPGGYIENNSYFYYLTDHLGNNRAVATATAGIAQRTQYYPFGLPFADAQARDLQPYTYNGKENDSRLQLNLMDYEARLYNSQYGGLPGMDPLLEKYYSWSPYVYVMNNPLRFIDPTGMRVDDYYSESGKWIYTDTQATDNIRIVSEGALNNLMTQYPGEGITKSYLGFETAIQNSSIPIENTLLSAEAYSNIFTDVLSKMDGVDLSKIHNGKVSVFTSGKVLIPTIDEFNNPNVGNGNAYTGSIDGKIQITASVSIYQGSVYDNRNLFSSVSNIQNLLGIHEYTGHGINGYDMFTTHYKAYDLQKAHPTWDKTTPAFKSEMLENAKQYESQRYKK